MAELMDPLAAAFRLDGTNGEAVVLMHGYTGVPAHFRPLAKVLHEAGCTVTVPRLAGHGTSMEDMATTGAENWIDSARAAASETSPITIEFISPACRWAVSSRCFWLPKPVRQL